MTTGMISPCWPCVRALKVLQNSMMFTPCWPRAGPTGGAGLAWPAVICSLMTAASFFFFGGISVLSLVVDVHPAEWRRPDACRFSREDRSGLGDLGERQLDRGFPT